MTSRPLAAARSSTCAASWTLSRPSRVAGRGPFTGPPKEPGPPLRHARGAARAVDRERRGTPVRQVAPELHERPGAPARRRPARRPVAEPPDDPGNPLAVEVLAGDDDDASVLPEEG